MDPTEGRLKMRPLADIWDAGTFKGAEYETLRRGAAMSFEERLKALEGMMSGYLLTREEAEPAPAERSAKS